MLLRLNSQSPMSATACPTCGIHYCALFATTNAATLADWLETHPPAAPSK